MEGVRSPPSGQAPLKPMSPEPQSMCSWYFPPPPPQRLSGCLTPAWERKDTSADVFKTRQLSTRWLTAPRSLNLS